jgi:uncharacterized protein (DUF305 family)
MTSATTGETGGTDEAGGTDDDPNATPTTGDLSTGAGETPSRSGLVPWWQVAVLCAAVGVLGMAVGSWLAKPTHPSASSVDVGYLQDMRFHHDQAVEMGLAYIDKNRASVDGPLRTIAGEIVVGQMLESGIMVQTLQSWGRAQQNESDTSMRWMGEPVPIDSMPGLATRSQLDALRSAEAGAASTMFVQLMIAHHQGGVHMAQYAAAHADTAAVRNMASAVVRNQRSEINELRSIASTLGINNTGDPSDADTTVAGQTAAPITASHHG